MLKVEKCVCRGTLSVCRGVLWVDELVVVYKQLDNASNVYTLIVFNPQIYHSHVYEKLNSALVAYGYA